MPDDTGPPSGPLRRDELASYFPPSESGSELRFDEDTYVRAYTDVAEAIERGELTSGLEHYLRAGRAEGRLQRPEYFRQVVQELGADVVSASATADHLAPAAQIEAFSLSDSGAIFLVGWADDRHNPLVAISARPTQSASHDWTQFCRLRRPDVEAVVQSPMLYHYGFWVFAEPTDRAYRPAASVGIPWRIELRFANGTMAEIQRIPVIHSDAEMRDSVMAYFATSEYVGNRWVEAFANLDRGAGESLIAFNRAISRSITAAATAERFGPQRKRFKGSIVVPLYGIADYMFLQASSYALTAGIEDYEFIYVVNSPELVHKLQREAQIGQMVYGLSQTLVVQPGNAGFGAANNVAVQFARSDRILCVNPDVFPRQNDWARRHTDALATLPAEQTRLFGTTLFYDDGSLMHGGMYFDVDVGIQAAQGQVIRRPMLRVEHYGKGAPPWAGQHTTPRPVPAVTGAFISIERAWYEKLGGFTEDYVYGHYEDADLCLKSQAAGSPVWMHDIRMWHLEGKGSLRHPQHEGGTLLNRWLFTRTWLASITPDLIGKAPKRIVPPEARVTPAAPSTPPRVERKLPPRRNARRLHARSG